MNKLKMRFRRPPNMLSMYMFQKVKELSGNGKKISTIARELGLDRKTVRKYLLSNTPPEYQERSISTKVDPFLAFEERVLEMLKDDPSLAAADIYEFIVEEGYTGSARTIRRRIADIKDSRPKERFFEQEYEPGEQSQFDFKEKIEIPFIFGKMQVYLHFGTLPYSNTFFIQSYPYKNYQCYMHGYHTFSETIGGMTKNIRIDNLSPCVKKVLKGNKRIYTDSFTTAIDYYGFKVLPCSPGKGNEKGDVERDIRTHARKILKIINRKKLIFANFEELNEWLHEYCKHRWSSEIKEKLSIEQKLLSPTPPRKEHILCKVDDVRSNNYGVIHHDGFTLSIPDNLIGVQCRLVIGAYDIKIYKNNHLESVHSIEKGNKESILLEDILPSLMKKPNAMIRWKHRDILFPNKIFHKFYSFIKSSLDYGSEAEFLRCVNLIQHTSFQELQAGIELLLESNQKNCFYDELKSLVLGDKVISVIDRFKQRPLEPDLKVYDKFIPAGGM